MDAKSMLQAIKNFLKTKGNVPLNFFNSIYYVKDNDDVIITIHGWDNKKMTITTRKIISLNHTSDECIKKVYNQLKCYNI